MVDFVDKIAFYFVFSISLCQSQCVFSLSSKTCQDLVFCNWIQAWDSVSRNVEIHEIRRQLAQHLPVAQGNISDQKYPAKTMIKRVEHANLTYIPKATNTSGSLPSSNSRPMTCTPCEKGYFLGNYSRSIRSTRLTLLFNIFMFLQWANFLLEGKQSYTSSGQICKERKIWNRNQEP